jgi:hypothetical protein
MIENDSPGFDFSPPRLAFFKPFQGAAAACNTRKGDKAAYYP